ncbi:MAG: hypothetical protein IPH55_11750 [Betaproteobacteria bacterium]|nr:hypothetical protein [Betaproteobacteria bacterium]
MSQIKQKTGDRHNTPEELGQGLVSLLVFAELLAQSFSRLTALVAKFANGSKAQRHCLVRNSPPSIPQHAPDDLGPQQMKQNHTAA